MNFTNCAAVNSAVATIIILSYGACSHALLIGAIKLTARTHNKARSVRAVDILA